MTSCSPLKVALTVDPEIPVPPLHYGGIERIVDMLLRGLGARGHAVTLFAHPQSTAPAPLVPWPGAESSSRIDTVRNMATLSVAALRQRFDIIHSFSRLAYLGPLLPLPVPKLMSYQREVSVKTTSGAWRLSRGTLEFSAISQWMMKDVARIGRWHLVPNGVPLEQFTFREFVADDAPLVFLGRVEEIKGPHLAIEVARRAGRRLVIAGNIPDAHRQWFDRTIAPQIDGHAVTFVGPVDDRAKNELLGTAAAFLMPILWEEPFGIVMAEAMACGAPVLGFRRGAVPEVVEHGVTGFVEDDVGALVASVAGLGSLSRRACRDRVVAFYSDEVIVDAYERVYREMLSR